MKKYTIPIFLPDKREKKDWIFNNQKILKEQQDITKESLAEQINEHLEKLQGTFYVEVAFFGADFTNLEEELQEELLEQLQNYIRLGKIDEVRVSIRPNNITRKKLKMLKKYKVKTIELEIYSTNDYILKKIGMNYNYRDIKKASTMVRFARFKLGHQMMIGLPESTKIDDINTARNIVKLKSSVVTITPVLVIKDTELEKEYEQKMYKPLTVVQSVEVCKEIVKIFNEKNIEINAIGFEPLDSEVKQEIFSEEVVAGPFHPAFKQIVESSLWYDAIVNKIKKLNAKVMQVEVTVNPNDLNNVVGYKQENIEKLKQTYDVDLIVTEDENMKQGKSKIEITKTFNWGND